MIDQEFIALLPKWISKLESNPLKAKGRYAVGAGEYLACCAIGWGVAVHYECRTSNEVYMSTGDGDGTGTRAGVIENKVREYLDGGSLIELSDTSEGWDVVLGVLRAVEEKAKIISR